MRTQPYSLPSACRQRRRRAARPRHGAVAVVAGLLLHVALAVASEAEPPATSGGTLPSPTPAERLVDAVDRAAAAVGEVAVQVLQPVSRRVRPVPDYLLIDPWADVPGQRRLELPGDPLPLTGCTTAPEDRAGAAGALDLRQAVEIALCRNPQTRQAWANLQAQSAQVGIARAAFLPSVNVGLSRSRDITDTVLAGGDALHAENRVWADGKTATLNWVLFDLGTRKANLDQARQTLTAALASQDLAVQTVFAATGQAYYDVWAAQAAAEAAEEAERTATQLLQAAQARARYGASTRLDALQAQTAVAQATLARTRAQGNVELAQGNLAVLLGLDARSQLRLLPDPAIGLGDGRAAAPLPAMNEFSADIDALMDQALQAHPSVRAAQAQLQVAQARRNAALGEGLPSLSLSASRYLNGRPNTPLSSSRSFESLVTLQWNFPLFEGFARGYKIREAQAQIGAREADLTAARIQASQEVWRQYQTLQVETKACLAAGDLLASSSELQTAARARYAAGAVDVTETLNALKDHAFARQEGIRALTAWRSARLRLLASLGRLGLWSIDPAAGAAATPAPR